MSVRLNKILFLSFVVICSLIFCVSVNASARSSIEIPGSDYSNDFLEGDDYLPVETTIRFTRKKDPSANTYSVYCTDSEKAWFYSGTKTFNYSSEMNSKIAYIIANGYPAKSLTGNAKKDYFITGLAIYYVLGDTIASNFQLNTGTPSSSTYKYVSSDVAVEMAKLVAGANSYTATEPSIAINLSNTNFTLSNDKSYYVSNQIGISTTGIVGSYTVSISGAPSGTIVTDVDGTTKNTFTKSEKFLVKVPVSSIKSLSISANVNISAIGTTYKAYKYSTSNTDIQSVVVGEKVTKSLSASTTLSTQITTRVEISKVNITNNQEISGAYLVVKDANGTIKAEWTSDGAVHIINNLLPGNYTLTETGAPAGFIKSTETIAFEVKADGVVVKKTMKNTPYIEISKQDAVTGQELPGATLVLKDANGNEDRWVSENTPKKLTLAPGRYTLTETIAPDGYLLSEETVEFTVESDGRVKSPVVMKNSPYIEISKQDAVTGKELPGATLVLKDANGTEVKWISGSIPYKVALSPGKYTLAESISPKGYLLNEETVEFTVESDGRVKSPVVMKNFPYIEISKQDATTRKELPGAHLVVKDSDGNIKDEWISENTPHKVALPPGKYTLTETIAPKGYKLSETTVEFTVSEDGRVKSSVVMLNEPEEEEIKNVKTGDFLIYIALAVGLCAIGYTVYYFGKAKRKR